MNPQDWEALRLVVLVLALSLAFLAIASWQFWLMFLGAMAIYRAHLLGRIPQQASHFVIGTVIAAVVVDWLFNFTLAVLVFRELPKHRAELVTHRLVRYVAIDTSQPNSAINRLRKHRADIICKRFLDPFDPSPMGHCTTAQGEFLDMKALKRV